MDANHPWTSTPYSGECHLMALRKCGTSRTMSETLKPGILDLEAVLNAAGLSRNQLVGCANLIGIDYNGSVSGVGPVKEVKLVKRNPTLPAGLAKRRVKMPTLEELRGLYFAHRVDTKFVPKFREPEEKATMEFLGAWGISDKGGRDLLAGLGSWRRPSESHSCGRRLPEASRPKAPA